MDNQDESSMQGHWVLASLGKKVLRPGGIELSQKLIRLLEPAGADVVEFAPGLGQTAREIIAARPRSYTGIEIAPERAASIRRIIGSTGRVIAASAENTGLPDASADVIIGEAMLSMQSDRAKAAIIAEAARILRPGGKYGIHEIGFYPEDIPEAYQKEIRQTLARSIRTNVRPQTVSEWRALLENAGLTVTEVAAAPLSLLESRRLIADEGLAGFLKIGVMMLLKPRARKRALEMRRIFRKYAASINAVALIAVKPLPASLPETGKKTENPL